MIHLFLRQSKKNNTVVRWLHLHFIDLQRATWRSSSADVCSRWTAATGTRAVLLSFWLLTVFNLISPARFVLHSLRLCPRKRFRDSWGSVHPECRVGDFSKTERGATSGRAQPARTHARTNRGEEPCQKKKPQPAFSPTNFSPLSPRLSRVRLPVSKLQRAERLHSHSGLHKSRHKSP